MFLYCDKGLNATAYFITPDENGELIQHQFGCVGCNQFGIMGRIEEIAEPTAGAFEHFLGSCEYPSAEVLSSHTNLRVKEVLGEALALLEDGRYVAVNNCD